MASYTYDAWGNFTATYSNGGENNEIIQNNPFLYRGYYYDYETGFYYLNSRYYDPVTGMFINADGYVSTGQGILGHNMFLLLYFSAQRMLLHIYYISFMMGMTIVYCSKICKNFP